MINSAEKFAIFIVSAALLVQADVSHLHTHGLVKHTLNPGPNDNGHFHDGPDSFAGYPAYAGPILVSFIKKRNPFFMPSIRFI